nr:MAG TPA: hypothetical protein [Caudoviricetes sp.]
MATVKEITKKSTKMPQIVLTTAKNYAIMQMTQNVALNNRR